VGDAGFVLVGYDDLADAPKGLRRAEAEFNVRFPVGLGKQQVRLGALPYGYTINQTSERRGDRLMRLSVLMGRGVNTHSLVLFAFVSVPAANADAEGVRHGQVFERIFSTFAAE
jgi:hypothetical protein